ncbi:peptide deformylase [Pseudooctadecabacter sp.]|uniref:peptide deformylase n=1 Tax=Pseudooctadecabacter sp. TaxID=1966338 RepID=UPI0035C7A342
MAKREVRMWPDPVLTQICAPVDVNAPDVAALIEDLFDTMYDAKGRGLAAPQIGVLQRMFVVDVTWKEGPPEPRVFINPEVASTSDAASEMSEQCLSIPDLPMSVTRPDHIQLRWSTRAGDRLEARFDGILARCILHEFDHLNGKVIFDHQPAPLRADLEARYAP